MQRVFGVLALVGALSAPAGAAVSMAADGGVERGVRILESPASAPVQAKPAPATPPRTAVNAAPTGPIDFCPKPFATTDLAFPSGDFDRKLSRLLKQHRTVVLSVQQPFAQAEPPPAPLQAWVAAAKAGGGDVRVEQYCKAARGNLLSWLVSWAKSAVGVKSNAPLVLAGYDVRLHADALDGVVTQVEFAPRPKTR